MMPFPARVSRRLALDRSCCLATWHEQPEGSHAVSQLRRQIRASSWSSSSWPVLTVSGRSTAVVYERSRAVIQERTGGSRERPTPCPSRSSFPSARTFIYPGVLALMPCPSNRARPRARAQSALHGAGLSRRTPGACTPGVAEPRTVGSAVAAAPRTGHDALRALPPSGEGPRGAPGPGRLPTGAADPSCPSLSALQPRALSGVAQVTRPTHRQFPMSSFYVQRDPQWPCLWCARVSPTRRALGSHQCAAHGDFPWEVRYHVRLMIAALRARLGYGEIP